MKRPLIAIAFFATLRLPGFAGQDLPLPPEITPALRAACETDVRRLCITDTSTLATVKSCVISKFLHLGQRCRTEIASAGLKP